MTPRIEKAINIFLEALKNNTLIKGNCSYCAVGNLVGAGLNDYEENAYWSALFYTNRGKQFRNDLKKLPNNQTLIDTNIKATDFSVDELAKIEYAFETNTKIFPQEYDKYSKEEVRADQLKGLEAVVEVMMDFDDVKGSIQELFTSKAELIPV